ncbi:hypothetical protein KR038_010800, partial [Drosophila bunnanda]
SIGNMRTGLIVGVIWVFIWPRTVHGGFVLKKVICESLDASYAEFELCEMKIVRRGVASFYMFLKLHKMPINNVDVNVSLLKRSNGYQPFLFNQTVDYCYYMRNPQAHPLIYTLHKVMFKKTNMNHSCPFDHDLKVENFTYDQNDMMDLPLPSGDYMIKLILATYKICRVTLKIYFKKN